METSEQGIPAALRRLAAESLPIYMALRAAPSTSPQDRWMVVLEYSRKIGAILGRSDAALNFKGDNPQLTDITSEIPAERACWELLETMFVEQGRTFGSVVEDLVPWLHRNAAALSDGPETIAPVLERLVPQLQAAPKPDEVPGFWTAAQQLCAVGWFDAATDLLGLHSIWADWQLGRSAVAPAAEAMEAAIVLMRTFPRLGQGKCHSLVAFEAYRQEWLLRCREALAQESLWSGVSGTATGEGVRTMLLIMAGDRAAISGVTGGWLEQFVALLRHSYPTLRAPGDLHRVAEAALQQKGVGEEHRSPLDRLVLSALRRDATAVLQLAHAHLGSWFMAHAPELLAASGAEAQVALKQPLSEGADQIEVYRVEYAMGLARFPSTWHLAAKVLLTCPNVGRAALRRLVADLPTPETDAEVRKVLLLLRSNGLDAEADALCSAAGARRAAAGLHAAAARWFCEGGDEGRLAGLAGALLPRNGWEAPRADDRNIDLLLESVATPSQTGPLAALRLFRDLQRAAAAARAAPAASDRAAQAAAAAAERRAAAALRALLAPDVVPRDRWLAVLFAGVPLLDGAPSARPRPSAPPASEGGDGQRAQSGCVPPDPPSPPPPAAGVNGALGMQDTQWLLARLEELQLRAWGPRDGPPGAAGGPEEALVEAVRLALARNLARVFVADASAPAGGGAARGGAGGDAVGGLLGGGLGLVSS